MNCSNCGGSIGLSPSIHHSHSQRHYSVLDCMDVMRIEMNNLKLQNSALQKILEHEVRGSHPCGSDCVTGGVASCIGCNDRYKAVFPIIAKTEKRSEESPKKCAVCGYLAHSGRCGEQGGSGPEDGYA